MGNVPAGINLNFIPMEFADSENSTEVLSVELVGVSAERLCPQNKAITLIQAKKELKTFTSYPMWLRIQFHQHRASSKAHASRDGVGCRRSVLKKIQHRNIQPVVAARKDWPLPEPTRVGDETTIV